MPRPKNLLYERLASLEVGEQAVLVQGVDFPGNPEIQRSNIHRALRNKGITCRSTRRNKQITITIVSKEK